MFSTCTDSSTSSGEPATLSLMAVNRSLFSFRPLLEHARGEEATLHRVHAAEPPVRCRDSFEIDAVDHADRDVGGPLVLRVEFDRPVTLVAGLHVDLMDGLDSGRLGVQPKLLDADDGAVAQQHGVFTLVDGVEGSEDGAERQ